MGVVLNRLNPPPKNSAYAPVSYLLFATSMKKASLKNSASSLQQLSLCWVQILMLAGSGVLKFKNHLKSIFWHQNTSWCHQFNDYH